MTITVSYPDTVYYPQANTTVNVTITPPYREERVIFIQTRGSTAETSGDYLFTPGFCYWNTSMECLRLYNGYSWSSHYVAPYSVEKCVFWHIEQQRFFYLDDNYLMQYVDSVYGDPMVCIKISDTAANPSVFDMYWDSSNALVKWWTGLEWVTAPVQFRLSHNTLYARAGGLYYYSSTGPMEFVPYYYYAVIYLRDSSGTKVSESWKELYGGTLTSGYTISLPGHNAYSGYSFVVKYLTESQYHAAIVDSETFKYDRPAENEPVEWAQITTLQGQVGAINPKVTWTTTPQEYPLAADTLSLNCTVTPTTSAPASVLRPYSQPQGFESIYGIEWTINKTAGASTWSGTLDDAVSRRRARRVSGYGSINSSTIEIELTEAGTYTITATGKYRNASGTITTFYTSVPYTVYGPPNPALELVSVTPAEYATGDDDPLNGLPPYTAVWKDVSAARDPYQIPQAGITIDFGDPDSGTRNREYFPNNGTTLITLANQSHSYDGYGPYVASLIITDKRGNVATGTMGFSPSQTPRLIKNPTLSPTQGGQPLLVQGQAYVAGTPLPEVEWSYELEGGSDYYTGVKEGEYAELSLLAGGKYKIICTASNEGTIVGKTEFEVTVTPAEIHADTPVRMNDFDVWVYDKTGTRVTLLHPDAAQYVDRYNHASYCEFKVPADCGCLDLLRPGGEIAIGYLGLARYCRIDEFRESDDGTEVNIMAIDAASSALAARTATVATRSTNGNGYDLQSCSAEALLRYFAIANTSGSRAIPRFILVGENMDRGGKCIYSARYEEVLEIIEDICADSGLGWECTLQGENPIRFGMKIREGIQRDILFADIPGRRTAKVDAYREYASPNVAITGGEGSGNTRPYEEYGSTQTTDLDRREIFVDAGDSAGIEEMQRMGELELLKQKEQSIRVYPGDEYILGVDYEVGDYVNIRTKSGVLLQNMQVIQATMAKDIDGISLVLECGTDLRGMTKLMREAKLANTYARK